MSNSLFSSLSPERKHFLKVMVLVSATIRNTRKGMSMSQKEFAQHMNVTQAMVSKWESGQYNFSMETIIRIYDRLNLPLNFEPIDVRNPMQKYRKSHEQMPFSLQDCYAA